MNESRNESRASRLRYEIEEEIATGRLRPGDRLDEASLAQRFGVSRTPIREALQQLATAGLIEIRPHRGAVVGAPDARRLLEMFEVMAELEAMCARLAARRLQPDREAELRRTLGACEVAVGAGDTDAYYRENEGFHHAVYAAGRNAFLAEQAIALARRLAPFRRLQLRVRNRMLASQAEHRSIVEAIASGDADRAAELMRAHVTVQGERFHDLVASLDSAVATSTGAGRVTRAG